ncbi:Asp23/Gls24 family envelope stress response protein [Actinotalea sp. Marseille-Q4924]|uniref:Asp23/Gls24 family envelope stress response protein n=1 Tax=Actinotalea sp. Marseille-Q4924 TaxID=2866571 RepID=UPI001CE46206|nr:Asp23/Gls24 family envelope stress response protein [Actinotalea sp. Marseille-Q4924]
MSQTTGSTTPKTPGRSQAGSDVSTTGGGGGLVTEQGRTSIADGVVSKIAGIATREVDGVFAVGGGAARAMGAVRERIGGKNHGQGVSVEVGERQAAVDVDVVVEYGYAIADVADGVRRNVIRSIERMTGLEVTEVNVAVGDIHIPGEESDEDDKQEQEPRVR